METIAGKLTISNPQGLNDPKGGHKMVEVQTEDYRILLRIHIDHADFSRALGSMGCQPCEIQMFAAEIKPEKTS